MPDVFTKTKRSQVMARIRGRGNKETELALAKLLRAARIRAGGGMFNCGLRNVECGTPARSE
jgi:G:T-mismatch repair DNA endonuclease (very short patch repair protein)